MTLKPGNRVRYKGNGQEMIVVEEILSYGRIRCSWIYNGERTTDDFAPAELELIPDKVFTDTKKESGSSYDDQRNL